MKTRQKEERIKRNKERKIKIEDDREGEQRKLAVKCGQLEGDAVELKKNFVSSSQIFLMCFD